MKQLIGQVSTKCLVVSYHFNVSCGCELWMCLTYDRGFEAVVVRVCVCVCVCVYSLCRYVWPTGIYDGSIDWAASAKKTECKTVGFVFVQ